MLDPGLGLPTDFAVQVVTQVGNYGEIFDANLTPLGLERGRQRAVDRRRAACTPRPIADRAHPVGRDQATAPPLPT